MRTIEATAIVAHDGTLTVHVPPDVTPGTHQIMLAIDGASREAREPQSGCLPGDLGWGLAA